MRISTKSRILASILVVSFCLPFMSLVTYGAESTILPGVDPEEITIDECEIFMRYVNAHITETTKAVEGMQPGTEGSTKVIISSVKEDIAKRNNKIEIKTSHALWIVDYKEILACAIMTGDVKMWMVPFFIRYVLEFIIGIAGLLAVGGVVYGGYLYLFAGLSDDKDKGKNAIKNGLIGLVLVLTAWAVVNIVISLVTM